METMVMIAAGRVEARASCLTTGVRSSLSPTVSGAELHDVVREFFHITPEPPFDNKDNTGELVATS